MPHRIPSQHPLYELESGQVGPSGSLEGHVKPQPYSQFTGKGTSERLSDLPSWEAACLGSPATSPGFPLAALIIKSF